MVQIDRNSCDVCGTCIAVCPTDVLSMETVLHADHGRCTSCGRCVDICPFGALSLDEQKDRRSGAENG